MGVRQMDRVSPCAVNALRRSYEVLSPAVQPKTLPPRTRQDTSRADVPTRSRGMREDKTPAKASEG